MKAIACVWPGALLPFLGAPASVLVSFLPSFPSFPLFFPSSFSSPLSFSPSPSPSLSSDPKSFLSLLPLLFLSSTLLLDQGLPICLFASTSRACNHRLWRECFVDLRLDISHLFSLLFLHCVPSLSVKSTILLQLMSLFFPKSTFCHLFSSL